MGVFVFYGVMVRPIDRGVRPTGQNDSCDYYLKSDGCCVVKKGFCKAGHQVVGIDFVESAIKNARDKVAALPDETARSLNFQVADALKPSLLQEKFGAVFDSGFYHLFNPDQCERLIDEVASILKPHGCYYLHEFAIEFPVLNVPRKISIEELQTRSTVEKGWRIKEIRTVEFLSRVAHPVSATCACIERLPAYIAPNKACSRRVTP